MLCNGHFVCAFFSDGVGASSKRILLPSELWLKIWFCGFYLCWFGVCTLHTCPYICVDLCVCIEALFVPFDLELVRFLWSSELKLFKVSDPNRQKFNRFFAPGMRSNVFLWFYSQINFPTTASKNSNARKKMNEKNQLERMHAAILVGNGSRHLSGFVNGSHSIGWANLWLEFKWIIEIHRIQWILSTSL